MSEMIVYIPYESRISKNHCFIAGDRRRGYVAAVRKWAATAALIIRAEKNRLGLEFKPPITLDIHCLFPRQRGRRPDVANFRAVIQDVVAKALEIDDVHFSGTDSGRWGVEPSRAGFELTIRSE